MNRLLNEIEEMKHVDYSGCATRRKHIMLAIKNHDMHALRAIVKEGVVLNKRDRLRLEPNPIKLEYGVAKEALQSYVAGGKLAKRNGLLEAENKTLKATNEELQKQLSMLSARNAAMAKKEKKIERNTDGVPLKWSSKRLLVASFNVSLLLFLIVTIFFVPNSTVRRGVYSLNMHR